MSKRVSSKRNKFSSSRKDNLLLSKGRLPLTGFTKWIVVRFIKNYRKINDLKVRSRYGSLEGWVSIVGNILLFVIKIIVGLSIKSVSLIAV